MNVDDLKWVIGLITAVVSAILGGFYKVGVRQSRFEAKMSDRHADLHDRIEEVKDGYVRRDDFHDHMSRQEKSADALKASVNKLDEKLDRLLGRK
ncbi:MAG: hypothetical protein COB84_09640 [Rhodobacteraceae bacterium]|nr:MAG: hypothetical protein COB84_09640 [Paracoccaceae bacterium]